LLVFFLVNGFAPVPSMLRIFYATGAFMAAMMVAMLISQIKYKHISPLLWFSGVTVVVLGGITIWLHDETFIKIKPTIYYAVVAGLLLFGLYTKRNLLQMVLGSAYPGLSEHGWRVLTRNWALFFIAMALINEAGLAEQQHRLLGVVQALGRPSRHLPFRDSQCADADEARAPAGEGRGGTARSAVAMRNDMQPVISISNLTKTYASGCRR
jgi:intracellular septation protein A